LAAPGTLALAALLLAAGPTISSDLVLLADVHQGPLAEE
jgi:hypothetical protein